MRIRLTDGLLYIALKVLKAADKRRTDLKYFDPDKVKHILVVSSTAIGDTLLSTPAIRAVRKRYPHSKIIAHFNVRNMSLFENNPDIDGIIPYYGGYRKFFGTIRDFRSHNFDLVLIFHGNEPQATPMAYLSGAQFLIKLPNTNEYRFLLSNRDELFQWTDFSHGVKQRLKVAGLAGCDISETRMVLPEAKDGPAAIRAFIKSKGIKETDMVIGLQVAASTVSRMWFADRFIELGKRIGNIYPSIKIIITGSPQEYDYCRKIADEIGENTVVSAGEVPLKYIASLLKSFKLLVTGDTGTMHVAIAVGTPVVSLFAMADSRVSGPYYDNERHFIIQKYRTCNPCSGKRCKYQKCMENISIDEVLGAIETVIFKNRTIKE